MIRIPNLSLAPKEGIEALTKQAAKALDIPADRILELSIAKQSIDARKKDRLRYVCTVDVTVENEEKVLKWAVGKNITIFTPTPYVHVPMNRTSEVRPIVVGMGPAGLFSALFMARNGLKPIILERGQDVDTRSADVEKFWTEGVLNTQSNVQFGEGGAGTFSDGKLTTGTHDPRISAVFEALIAAGAPADILYSHKPHIGTDILRDVVKNIRKELLELGCDIRFGHQLVGIGQTGHQITEISVQSPEGVYQLDCDALVLAIGHSARDTFQMCYDAGLPMEQKNFAIGVRIEHKQMAISRRQYGDSWRDLPPSDYKLACHLPSGRSAFTFCVCPGGTVVGAASSQGELVCNGMSYRARDGVNINGGLLVGVGPEDFPSEHPLAGVEFQRQWEQAAFVAGGSNYFAPAQRVQDFLNRKPSEKHGAIAPTYQPGVSYGTLDGALPDFVLQTLRDALPVLDRKVKGFAAPDAILTGVETRSSSPVRILRDEHFQSEIRGIYPCGEGAGYAGGIVSAAVDGIRVAEAVATGD